MDQDEKRPASQTPPPETPEEPPRRTAMQNFYEHFRGVPLRYLDIFIGGPGDPGDSGISEGTRIPVKKQSESPGWTPLHPGPFSLPAVPPAGCSHSRFSFLRRMNSVPAK